MVAMALRLAGIKDLSIIDWLGKISTIVTMQGCNLRCPWCNAVEEIDPQGGRLVGTRDVVEELKKQMPIANAVVLTGGEPITQTTECLKILMAAKKLGLVTGIETNATDPRALKRLLPQLDFLAVDVKAPPSDAELYNKITGSVGIPELSQKVWEGLRTAINSGVEVEARTTIVPTLNNSKGVIEQLAEDVAGVGWLRLQQFRNAKTFDPSFQSLPQPDRGKLRKLAKVARKKGLNVRIFTVEGGLEEV
jgi:pyruvate formate lyase activating enzyme